MDAILLWVDEHRTAYSLLLGVLAVAFLYIAYEVVLPRVVRTRSRWWERCWITFTVAGMVAIILLALV